MPFRIVWTSILLAVLATLAACSPFQSYVERFEQNLASDRAAISPAVPEYLMREIAPCAPIEGSIVDPCEPDVRVTTAAGASIGSSGGRQPNAPSNVRRFLDGGSIISISHVVLRGTYIPNTARCASGIPYHVPSHEEPGLFQYTVLMQCFADIRVNAYILGSGPPELTVVVDFHHYWEEAYASVTPGQQLIGEDLIDEITFLTELGFERGYSSIQSRLGGSVGIYGREVILFVGPSHNHSVEAWQIIATWDVQRQEDGTVIAVHPAREYWKRARPDEYQTHRAALEMELPTFTQAVADAQTARIAENNGRIAPASIESRREGVELPMLTTDANRLSQYYTDTGAYDHPDGPPTQPPPACGQAVPNREDANRPLIRDCRLLLALKDALAGTAALNWSASLAIGSWTGVTIGGTPERATGVNLSSSSLNGSIPDGLGDLSALTTLDLSSNQLTGAIPASLGDLSDLSTLKLSGNAFSGCIPPALRDVTTNDLASVGLSYCDMLTPPPAPDGVELALADATFTITWDVVSGADKYEPQYQTVIGDEWTALPETEEISTTHTPAGGLTCGTTYGFRVRSYGDGTMHSAEWGTPSDEVTHATEACNAAPDFDTDSYAFTVDEDAAVGHVVGTVSAPDTDEGDMVSYSITTGNEDGKFDIGDSSGEITVFDSLDYEITTAYTLTVQADDGREGTDTAAVEITVNDVAEDPAPAPSGLSVSLSEGAFTLTWHEVSGAARYEAQHRASDTDDWTALAASAAISATYTPEGGPACGTTYQFRVRSYGDGETYAEDWGAESEEETYDTEACNVAPDFSADTYTFAVDESVLTGILVGTVSATDPDEDTLAYSITTGNEDGKFAIGEDTGAITLAAPLDQTLVSSYTLTVRADDGNGGEDTASVAVPVESICRNGTVIPDPGDNPDLATDCLILYGTKDILTGTASLDWRGDAALADWPGVEVDSGRVHQLVLREMGLDGTIPAALGGLSRLRRLDLDENQLTGGVPSELGSLSLLTHLSLRGNRLDGTIPVALGRLGRLSWLDLARNQLAGEIPAELGSLSSLTYLFLNDNRLDGTIPAALGGLSQLYRLNLNGNQLTGEIPVELENLSQLTYLYLDANLLEGAIPAELGNLGNLTVLYLYGNRLNGAIPASLGDLDALRQLVLSENGLSGSIPEELGDMASLQELWVDVNQLSGRIPVRLGRLELTDLFLSRNSFDGCLPHGLRQVPGNDFHFPELQTMPDCPNEAPVFSEDSYSFTVAEDMSTGDVVGGVSAEDPDGRTVAYAFTAGNDAGRFLIDTASGELSVAAALDYETATSYTLTVQAEDGYELTSEVTVTIRVTDVAE